MFPIQALLRVDVIFFKRDYSFSSRFFFKTILVIIITIESKNGKMIKLSTEHYGLFEQNFGRI